MIGKHGCIEVLIEALIPSSAHLSLVSSGTLSEVALGVIWFAAGKTCNVTTVSFRVSLDQRLEVPSWITQARHEPQTLTDLFN